MRRRFFELDAWETTTFSLITVTAAPGKHGVPEITYMLQANGFTVYFGGDTLLIPELSEIPQRFPQVDVALLAINGLQIRPLGNRRNYLGQSRLPRDKISGGHFMSTEQNKTLAYSWLEEVINRKNLAAVDELFATNLVDPALPPGLAPGIEGFKQLISAYFHAFPDLQVSIEETIAERDNVVTRLTWRGTHRGKLMGMPPTGKQIAFSGMESYRITDVKIVEIWAYSDNLGMLQQLGLIVPMG